MKLAQRYNRVNIFTSFIILVITGLIYYLTIHYILTQKLDSDLKIEEEEIGAYAKNYGKLPFPGDFLNQQVKYKKLGQDKKVQRSFLYTEYYDAKEKETEPGRTLVTSIKIGEKTFQVNITKSRVESEDLMQFILLITVGVTLLLLVSLLLINRLLLQRIWRPFYHTLNMMKDFNLTATTAIGIEQTNIDEFNELSNAAAGMAESVNKDYKELKSFTDNASHEMMTPLAVIRAKLDLLLQGEPFSNKQGQLVEEIYNSVGKLGRLNQSLILLAKIENKLVPELEELDLKNLINQKVAHFNELLIAKEITIEVNLTEKSVMMSSYLADILLNNLFANAIRHNTIGGNIFIKLTAQELTFANTGNPIALNDLLAFDRFQKNPSSEGMGLGLAIVKQIVALHKMEINYKFEDGLHIFTIRF